MCLVPTELTMTGLSRMKGGHPVESVTLRLGQPQVQEAICCPHQETPNARSRHRWRFIAVVHTAAEKAGSEAAGSSLSFGSLSHDWGNRCGDDTANQPGFW